MNAAKVYHLSENGLSPHRREGWGEQNSLAYEATCKLKAMNRAVFDRGKKQMGVLLTQTCSEGRKENDWFTDSTNKNKAEMGSEDLNVWREHFRQIRY